MQRVQDPTAVASQPAPPALSGPTGFFQGAIASAIVTRVRYWWLNMIQEELVAFLTAAGLALDGSQTVLAAVRILTGFNLQIVSASGAITVPTGKTSALALMWGGGGGGGGTTGSGSIAAGGGGATFGLVRVGNLTPGSGLTMTIGQGGAGGQSGGNGTGGGATSFDGYAGLTGGGGGQGAGASTIATTPGAPGTSLFLYNGATGWPCYGSSGGTGYVAGSTIVAGSSGAAFGCGSASPSSSSTTAQAGFGGPNPGQGGSGGLAGGGGGPGSNGLILILWGA
jgi:hypothetical protein